MAVAFRRIIVPEHHQYIATGQSVTVMVEVIDDGVIPRRLNPTHIPVFTLFNPSNATKVLDDEMSFISDGLYAYTYRVLSTEPLGRWIGSFTAINNSDVARIEKITLFRTIRATDFADVSYLAITGQDGSVWFWYIDNAAQLAISQTLPSFLIKDVVSLSASPVYWIQLTNALGEIRYVLPDALGQIIKTAVQPSIGTGVVGSYIWMAENSNNYILTLDSTDEIVVQGV